MNFLKWYSAVVVTISIVALLISVLTSKVDLETNLWGIAMYIPISIYLWILIKKGK